jgi:hypothetical protein
LIYIVLDEERERGLYFCTTQLSKEICELLDEDNKYGDILGSNTMGTLPYSPCLACSCRGFHQDPEPLDKAKPSFGVVNTNLGQLLDNIAYGVV